MPTRVLLLRDAGWPTVAAVCCWRHSIHSAFTLAGATVTEATYWQVPAQRTAGTPTPSAGRSRSAGPRAAWLPAAARRPLARAYRGPRAMMVRGARLARRLGAAPSTDPASRRADGIVGDGGLVIAESLAAARYAAGAGVPRGRLWALALPSHHLFAEEDSSSAAELARVAPLVGGFLAGDEPARESVERATSNDRTRVEPFPPVAADRPCPMCGQAPAGPESEVPESVAPLVRRPSVGTRAAQLRAAEALLAAAAPREPAQPRPRRSVLLAGFDLKFATELAEQLDRRTDLALTVDDWPGLAKPTDQTEARLREADAVFAEWARTSAVWLSRRKRRGQFLAVRLHRFELDSRYPREMAVENLDAVVYIAPLFGRRIHDELGWPAEKLVYIPNYFDVAWLDRPKLPGARFTVGFVGMEWSRKRFDLALDLLSRLRREDLRFTMVVRSAMPWHNKYVWAQPAERDFVSRCFTRIEQDPLLRTGVVFDQPGRDMARWYRRVGYLASTSDEEGSHASVAEAMASGAVPVVRSWAGAAEIYGKEWIHTSTDQAVTTVLESTDLAVWGERAAKAKAEIRSTHDPAAVVEAWADLLQGDVAAARRHFSEYAPVMGVA